MTDTKDALKTKANSLRKTLAAIDKMTGAAQTVVNRQEVATFFGVSIMTVDTWLPKGMPGKRGNYDLHKIVIWLRTEGPWRPLGGNRGTVSDELIEGPESEWTEEYRKWKARIAELDYQERVGQLISVDRSTHVWADVVMPEVRGFAERVIKAHGNGTADDWAETCARIDTAIEREFTSDGSGIDNQNGSSILDANSRPVDASTAPVNVPVGGG